MKNKNGLVAISLFMALAFCALFTRNQVFAVADKVTICHATGAATNPYVRIVVPENAIAGHFENNGTPKDGHEDDLLFQGEVDCPGGTSATPTNTPTPTGSTQQPTATPIPTVVLPTLPGGNVEEGNIDPCFVRQCPTNTPTPTVEPTATPTSTPGPTATPGQGGNGGGSSNGGSSSSSSTGGSVQGATTTLAATGTFSDAFMNMVGLAGVVLTTLSAARYGKKS